VLDSACTKQCLKRPREGLEGVRVGQIDWLWLRRIQVLMSLA
jgi:hypothetical protein